MKPTEWCLCALYLSMALFFVAATVLAWRAMP